MTEFWEESFKSKQAMWGFEPADSAIDTARLFHKNGLGKILIPGFGYGRNAKAFIDKGLDVTGIEISETAIALARKKYGDKVKVYHCSVTDMPHAQGVYDGIFCYALIHLLNETERYKLIEDCYNLLKSEGIMVFVAISVNDGQFGKGEKLSENSFVSRHGVKLYFYDLDSINKEFGKYGLVEATEINEHAKNNENRSVQIFWKITCKKIN